MLSQGKIFVAGRVAGPPIGPEGRGGGALRSDPLIWRRGWDSNPRGVAPYTLSRRAP